MVRLFALLWLIMSVLPAESFLPVVLLFLLLLLVFGFCSLYVKAKVKPRQAPSVKNSGTLLILTVGCLISTKWEKPRDEFPLAVALVDTKYNRADDWNTPSKQSEPHNGHAVFESAGAPMLGKDTKPHTSPQPGRGREKWWLTVSQHT